MHISKQEVTKRLPVGTFPKGGYNSSAAPSSPSTKRSYKDGSIIYSCAVISALKLFATKWKPCIICYLAERPMRYNSLYRIIPNISRKILSEHLDELESSGLIIRTPYDAKLQRVEYALSPKGRSLMPLLYQIQNWGLDNIDGVLSIQQMIAVTMD